MSSNPAGTGAAVAATRAEIAYVGRGVPRPRYYANDHSRDVLEMAPVQMEIRNARGNEATLEDLGFQLVSHRSAVSDFNDRAAAAAVYRQEIIQLIGALSGADQVQVNSPGILRFSERSARSGTLDNSRPARFAHVDISDSTAATFAERALPQGRRLARSVHFNVWRVFSAPPQDVPLAVCDARSVRPRDLIAADAVFDAPGQPEWSFEGLVLAHAPTHRWHWYPDMHRGEALVFKTHDSDPASTHCVPHVAFDNPQCATGAAARASIEMRALALWWA
ncbi:MAG: CmcJ/NvfI family oxidoreductase [Steroidobacteraceae bacterium]